MTIDAEGRWTGSEFCGFYRGPQGMADAARAYLGRPFKHQGRNPAIGIDCIGLLVLAARDCGLPQADADSTAYGKDPHDGLLESHLVAAFGPRLPTAQMQPGDIAAVDYAGAVRHVGIVGRLEDGALSLIHTNQRVGRVTEARIDAKWQRRIAGVYRPGAV